MILTVTEFKAKCLAILGQVQATRETVTLTRRGIPVADVVPVGSRKAPPPLDRLRGSVEILGDITKPVLPSASWEAEAGRLWTPNAGKARKAKKGGKSARGRPRRGKARG